MKFVTVLFHFNRFLQLYIVDYKLKKKYPLFIYIFAMCIDLKIFFFAYKYVFCILDLVVVIL